MKKYILHLLALSTLFIGVTSCDDFLSTSPTEIYSEDLVWGSSDMVDRFVVGNYNSVFSNFVDFRNLEMNFTDNYVYNRTCPAYLRDQMTNTYDWGLNSQFTKIRNCNLIIEKCAASEVLDDASKKEFTAEAKMMRAMIYFDLARKGGRYMWVDKVLDTDSDFQIPLTANIVESYQHVLTDIREAIPDLPVLSTTSRLTKNAGYALLSEVCLTAAAYTNDATSLQNGKSLYQEAVDAVDSISGVSLTSDYGAMFNEKDRYSDEIILARYWSKDNTNVVNTIMQQLIGNFKNAGLIQNGCGPVFSYDCIFECWCDSSPSQNLVDDYLVVDQKTGKAVRWDESTQFTEHTKKLTYQEAKGLIPELYDGDLTTTSPAYQLTSDEMGDISDLMYDHRDARFAASIISDKDTFYGETINMADHGNYGRWIPGNTCAGITNYMPRKSIYEDCSPRPYWNVPTNYHLVIFRYGKALLNKAEALLQLNKVSEAVETFNLTRVKHGQLPESEAKTLEEAWTDYKRERRVDLMFEGDYYYSQRRWGMYGGAANDGKASQSTIAEFSKPATFIEIKADRTACYVGQVQFSHEQRVFNPRSYLFPITRSVIVANDAITDADQNPGWE